MFSYDGSFHFAMLIKRSTTPLTKVDRVHNASASRATEKHCSHNHLADQNHNGTDEVLTGEYHSPRKRWRLRCSVVDHGHCNGFMRSRGRIIRLEGVEIQAP